MSLKNNGKEANFRTLQHNSFIADVISLITNQATAIGFECLSKVVILMAPIISKTRQQLTYIFNLTNASLI